MNNQHHVKPFVIFRIGKACDWDITVEQIAEKSKLPVEEVEAICREKNWRPVNL